VAIAGGGVLVTLLGPSGFWVPRLWAGLGVSQGAGVSAPGGGECGVFWCEFGWVGRWGGGFLVWFGEGDWWVLGVWWRVDSGGFRGSVWGVGGWRWGFPLYGGCSICQFPELMLLGRRFFFSSVWGLRALVWGGWGMVFLDKTLV